jgi:hypothetical protein
MDNNLPPTKDSHSVENFIFPKLTAEEVVENPIQDVESWLLLFSTDKITKGGEPNEETTKI